ncbi:concanavalin A-like lectin/glucanase [Schizophyllum commune H4-8]|uniref:concanavalin A-like lectin/glucanase n=1 Tax=Schizophyllum commune (strain H4-8 / FGSC 9210) TaxID=578458 RepID=UPI0021606CCA|nr:concanavalin A-like lectin/glucanase [Schizophyllum commune H4-8]KAI5897239.1 concanavalin A-like lectin/glucanase [Schizophyllum commune H4-8]
MVAPSIFGPHAQRRRDYLTIPTRMSDPPLPHYSQLLDAQTSRPYSLTADPSTWGVANLMPDYREPDDRLHYPDWRRDRGKDMGGSIATCRGLTNLGCVVLLSVLIVALFAGYPIATALTKTAQSRNGGKRLTSTPGFNLGGINGTGQVPMMQGNWGPIDPDTPEDVRIKTGWTSEGEFTLVFSDEFNTDYRTFYPGDDPFWEAVDLHYWGTNNLEWYDPEAITTKDGALRITLSQKPDHGLDYMGGMLTTWNKFCFTGGIVEVAVQLPGASDISGLWPAIWSMGNLGRAGYGATLDGLWPYSYDSCDVGTMPNQTKGGLPLAATQDGDTSYGGALSYQSGQRLSRCTCPGSVHPGPMHADGTHVGRAAPEIDLFEGEIIDATLGGQVSQSCQWAPFNHAYEWLNDTGDSMQVYDPDISAMNGYKGGVYQQATSVVTQTNYACYELEFGCFAVYGFEYVPGFDDAKAWTLRQSGLAEDPLVEIGPRPIPQEPMYLIMNLGMSENFGEVDLDHLTFPTTMSIDYVRVYQPSDKINIGCDPPGFPTSAYIDQFYEAYTVRKLCTDSLWTDGKLHSYRIPT